MREALAEAEKALHKDEVPVGAVVVYEGSIVGRGHNLIETLQDPTAHAEMLAITAAANFLASWRLIDTSLYVTLEPCAMCTGAILLARIPCVFWGSADPRIGACGSVLNIPREERLYAKVKMAGGILGYESQQLLQTFFNQLRTKK
ncbi:nucleoside deaminase [candidate division KSB1 bacterium]|nr:nucleoside deaminase [candidate division KSB1 bacterium]